MALYPRRAGGVAETMPTLAAEPSGPAVVEEAQPAVALFKQVTRDLAADAQVIAQHARSRELTGHSRHAYARQGESDGKVEHGTLGADHPGDREGGAVSQDSSGFVRRLGKHHVPEPHRPGRELGNAAQDP